MNRLQQFAHYGATAVNRIAALAQAGIDPAHCFAVRDFAGAESALARLGDSPARQLAEAAFIAGDAVLAGRTGLAAAAARCAPDFAGGEPPPPGAAPLDWYAWALAVTPTPR